jgi:integrase
MLAYTRFFSGRSATPSTSWSDASLLRRVEKAGSLPAANVIATTQLVILPLSTRICRRAGRTGISNMLRHTLVTTMLDARVDLRDVQIAARHADPRTTMRYDRARKNLDRHPNHVLAAYMASGT